MKYLVTGGAGFIGSHTCEALLQRGDSVVAVDDFNDYYNPSIKERNVQEAEKHPAFKLFSYDITNFNAMLEVFEEARPDRVIHLAARAGVRASFEQPDLYGHTNIGGTNNLLVLARQHRVQNFVFASSSSVYGERQEAPFREDDPLDVPVSPYAATKKLGELLCRHFSLFSKLPIACLRFFTVYGPRGRPDMAPHKFLSAVMNEKPIDRYGDGSSLRDYTYISDIVQGILAASNLNNPTCEVINLGNSNPVTLNEFISTVERVVGKKAVIHDKPVQEGDVSQTYAAITKAKKLLGWQPETPLETGLGKQYEYLRTSAHKL